jgi:hypothetical protein
MIVGGRGHYHTRHTRCLLLVPHLWRLRGGKTQAGGRDHPSPITVTHAIRMATVIDNGLAPVAFPFPAVLWLVGAQSVSPHLSHHYCSRAEADVSCPCVRVQETGWLLLESIMTE